MRLQVRAKKSLVCLRYLSQIFHFSRIHFIRLNQVLDRRHLHVHVCLALHVLLLLRVFALLRHLLQSLEFAAVAHAHASILHGDRNSGGAGGLLPVQRSTSYCLIRTRVGLRVPREGGVPKVGFPVRPKICALSQRWRQR